METGTFYTVYKNILTLLLLGSLFLPMGCRLGIVGWFYLNQAYIAKELCVNRFEVASSCEGGCYLDSMLQEVEQEAEKLPEYLLSLQELLLFNITSFPFTLTLLPAGQQQKLPAVLVESWNSSEMEGIFRPPRAGSQLINGTSQIATAYS